MALDPVAVALKFGFLAVLYLFLLWIARSALKDLRRGGAEAAAPSSERRHRHAPRDRAGSATPTGGDAAAAGRDRGRACGPGAAYDLSEGALLGRGDDGRHPARGPVRLLAATRGCVPQGDVVVLEDLGSTNGTYLNGEPLRGPQPLHVGDRDPHRRLRVHLRA